MNTHALVATALLALTSGNGWGAEDPKQEVTESKRMAHPAGLPRGMARADDPAQVAALDLDQRSGPTGNPSAAASPPATANQGVSERQLHALTVLAYRTQLENERLTRRLRQQEAESEQHAKKQAEEYARQLEIRQAQEQVRQRNEVIHAWQRRLNDRHWEEQRLRKIVHRATRNDRCRETPHAGAPVRHRHHEESQP